MKPAAELDAAPEAISRVARRALLLSSATFALIGACITIPGALLPILVDDFHISLIEAGSMLAFQPVGYLLAVIATGGLVSRFGVRWIVPVAFLVGAAGFGAFGLATGWTSAGAAMFAFGLGFGTIEVGVNTALLAEGGSRRTNLLNFAHLFFGVGCVLAPAAATRAVNAGMSWRSEFLIAGGAIAALGVGWAIAALDVGRRRDHASGAAARKALSAPVLVLAALLGIYVGVEVGVGGWLTKYMTDVHGLDLSQAGTALSLYWLGLTGGRLALSAVAHRIRERSLLIALSAFATAAAVLGLSVPNAAAAEACFALTGLGFSGIFPTVMALGAAAGPDDVARVTSILITGAGIGGILFPWVMAAISDGAGLTAGMLLYVAGSAAMIALSFRIAPAAKA